MQKITLEIDDTIYNRILSFLQSLPKELVYIQKESLSRDELHKNLSDNFHPRDFFGLANTSKDEIDSYLQKSREEWSNTFER